MITPKQLKNHEYQMVGRNAYKSAEVDAYMDEIYESYEQMFRENAELVKKLGMLADKISDYKKDEDNIRNALLMAERMKDSILSEANDRAQESLAAAEEKVRAAKNAVDEKTALIIDAAQKNAEKIVRDANERAEETLKLAQSNATKLLAKAQEIYDEQVNTVKDEAEKEREYLNKIKEESAKIRASLMDTYKMQIELLEFTPDFSEEVAKMHMKEETSSAVTENEETKEKFEAAVEEIEASEQKVEEAKEEVLDDVAEDISTAQEDDEDEIENEEVAEKVDDYINDESSEEFFKLKIDSSASDITMTADNDEADVAIVIDEGSPVDKYINMKPEEFEDIDTGRSTFDEEADYDEDEDYEKTVYTPNDEITFFDRNED